MKLLFAFLLLLIIGCKNGESVKRSPTGAAGELLLVMDDSVKGSPIGQSIIQMLIEPMVGLPQSEETFPLSIIPHRAFNEHAKTFRNILIVEISKLAQRDTVVYIKNNWASDQAIATISANTKEGIQLLTTKSSDELLGYFVDAERARFLQYNINYPNTGLRQYVNDLWDIDLMLPVGYNKAKSDSTFTWFTLETPESSTGIIIYDCPYVDENSFNMTHLIQIRDSVLAKKIPGPSDGSFMTTELDYPIHSSLLTVDGSEVFEMRGLWKVKGDMMGGPFVSHAHYDKKGNRIIVVEGYLYAPEKPNKRNLVRQIEAILFSYKNI